MKKLYLLLIAVLLVLSLASCTPEIMSGLTAMLPHTCADANSDGKCDTCQKAVTGTTKTCKSHVDNNNDGICDTKGCGATVKKVIKASFDGVKNKKKTITYDGKPHSLEVVGAPEDAEIEYDVENSFVNAGNYEVTAYITAPGYEDLELTATLIIKKKTITIVWVNDYPTYPMNGKTPDVKYTFAEGDVVEGDNVSVKFDFGGCEFTEETTGTLTATSANPNYQIKSSNGANKLTFFVGEVSYTVKYVDNTTQGTDPKPSTVDHGDTLIAPTVLKSGYEFVGWFDENDTLWDFDNPVTEDMTLTAKWKLLDYTVEYHTNGGINAAANPTTCNIETGLKALAPTRDGKIFLGWYTDSAMTEPLTEKTLASTKAKTIHLYAKWSSVEYTDIITGNTLGSDFILTEHLADGSFRYTFVADVKSFANNGVIRIGRGKDTRDGAYIEITSNSIIVYNNDGDFATREDKSHTLAIEGYVVIDVVVKNRVTIYLRTAAGTTEVSRDFVGKNGEIFVTAENAELERCVFGWAGQAYEEPVWILAESSINFQDKSSWINNLRSTGYIDFLLMSAYGQDSADVLAAFSAALDLSVPKYAVWSFPNESGAAYDANLASFLAICEAKGITPILTADLVAINPANAEKNAAVIASGERYINFASLESYSGTLYDGGYTEFGTLSMFGQFMADFPEIATPNTPLKSASAALLDAENPTLNITSDIKLKDGKVTIFTAKINGTLDGEEKIVIGHGADTNYSGWLEITSEKVFSYRKGAHGDPGVSTLTHRITIKNYITIIMIQDENLGKRFTILTDGASCNGSFSSQACNGTVSVSVQGGIELTDARGYFAGLDYDAPIWAFGASYFSLNDPNRWTNYLYSTGYADDVLVIGVGGLNSPKGMIQLEDALQYATPKYIVWGYGINDGADPEGGINEKTYENHIKFLEICEEKGIIPIFFSTPCLPLDENGKIRNHEGKMEYVLEKLGRFAEFDYRVASLPHAVNAYENGAPWYPGMMSSDLIHPLAPGARNMFMELTCALPELMLGGGELLQTEKFAEVYSGTSLTINSPDYVDGEYGFTFIADYSGAFEGALEIGNGKDVEGGTWVKITASKIEVYTRKAGVESKVAEFANEIKLEEIIMVTVHVVNGEASISLVSSAENTRTSNTLYTVKATWGYAGKAFAVADSTRLKDAQLSFVYEK